jgi:DNA-binding transcriptional LysR family regulator
MKQLSLQALKSFHEIVQTGTGIAAAKRLGLSQSGISRLITQLEASVGFELFYREKGLVPTPEGMLLFEEVSLAFLNIERINTLVRDIRSHSVGELRIVSSPSFAEAILPAIVTLYAKAYPNVRLHLHAPPVATARLLVATRAAECGFTSWPCDQPDLRAERILSSDTVCVMPLGHPLAASSDITPAMLADQPIIGLGAGTAPRLEQDAVFKKARVTPNVKIETHTVGTACALAASGMGIAIVNAQMARHFLKNELAMVPFNPRLPKEFAFITSALVPMSRLTAAFLDVARAHFAQQSGNLISDQNGDAEGHGRKKQKRGK